MVVGTYEVLDRYTYTRNYEPQKVDFTEDEFLEAQWKAMTASVFLRLGYFTAVFIILCIFMVKENSCKQVKWLI